MIPKRFFIAEFVKPLLLLAVAFVTHAVMPHRAHGQFIREKEISIGIKAAIGNTALTSPVLLTNSVVASTFTTIAAGAYCIIPFNSPWLAFQPELYYSVQFLPKPAPLSGNYIIQSIELPLLLNQVISAGGRTPIGFGQPDSITTYTAYGPTLQYAFSASETFRDNGVRSEQPLSDIRRFNVGLAAAYGFEMHYGKTSISTEIRVQLNFLPFITAPDDPARSYGVRVMFGYTFGQ
jgi:hypothetical protein